MPFKTKLGSITFYWLNNSFSWNFSVFCNAYLYSFSLLLCDLTIFIFLIDFRCLSLIKSFSSCSINTFSCFQFFILLSCFVGLHCESWKTTWCDSYTQLGNSYCRPPLLGCFCESGWNRAVTLSFCSYF